MIEQQPLRPSTRELYERNVRNHIDGHPIARLDLHAITGVDLADYKGSLKIGQSAWNNVQQLLSKAFNRAIMEASSRSTPP